MKQFICMKLEYYVIDSSEHICLHENVLYRICTYDAIDFMGLFVCMKLDYI